VHACPESSNDVGDEPTTRLVIIHPKYAHKKGAKDSDALGQAKTILETKGTGPRLERNCLLFLAADAKDLEPLLQAVANYLAWKSIEGEAEQMDLHPSQRNQAVTKTKEYDDTVAVRLGATYAWGLAPRQSDPTAAVEWEDFKVGGEGTLAERATTRFTTEWALRPKLPGVELRNLLDKYLWTERDYASIAQLHEWFGRYLYLPRLAARQVVDLAVQDGASVLNAEDTFAVAAGYDEAKKRFTGLKIGEGQPGVVDLTTLLVKTAVARAQREKERGPSAPPGRHDSGQMPRVGEGSPASQKGGAPTPKLPPNVFVGSVKLDGLRVVKEAGRVSMEVVEHLSTLPDAEVDVTLEIRVKVPEGVKDDVVRTVSENAKTLKFQNFSFERE
jgi:hypothetical protein